MAPELQFGTERGLEKPVFDFFVAEACALGRAPNAYGVVFRLCREAHDSVKSRSPPS